MIVIKDIATLIRQKKKTGKTVFVCGNGGSAATAEHFTNDLFAHDVKAVCLSSNMSIITMIANDHGYEFIFAKQLELYAQPDDLLIVFSCSGMSKNIVNAVQMDLTAVKIFAEQGEAYKDAEVRHLAIAHGICKMV